MLEDAEVPEKPTQPGHFGAMNFRLLLDQEVAAGYPTAIRLRWQERVDHHCKDLAFWQRLLRMDLASCSSPRG